MLAGALWGTTANIVADAKPSRRPSATARSQLLTCDGEEFSQDSCCLSAYNGPKEQNGGVQFEDSGA